MAGEQEPGESTVEMVSWGDWQLQRHIFDPETLAADSARYADLLRRVEAGEITKEEAFGASMTWEEIAERMRINPDEPDAGIHEA